MNDVQLVRLGVDGLEQVRGVHRLNEIHLAHHLLDLVGLKMADKMDLPGPLIGVGRQMGGELLDPVFPAHGNSRGNGLADGFLGRTTGGNGRGGDF